MAKIFTKLDNFQSLVNFQDTILKSTIVCRADILGNIIYVNENFLQISGYTSQELYSKDHQTIHSEYHPITFWNNMWQTISNGKIWREDVKNKTKDGHFYWLDTLVMPVLNEDGTILEFLSIGNDITDRKKSELYHLQDGSIQRYGLMMDETERLSAESSLKQSIIEKDLLIKEIHHRVKNSLQLISSLFYIRMSKMERGPIRSFLEETRQKVHSIALIHETLLKKHSVHEINMSDFLERQLLDLQTVYGNENIKVQHLFESLSFPIDIAVSCSLILTELFTNAMKHAFMGRKSGIIKISLSKKANNVKFVFSDNGIGFIPHENNQNNESFGMQMLDIFSNQLNANIYMNHTKGTKYQITFEHA